LFFFSFNFYVFSVSLVVHYEYGYFKFWYEWENLKGRILLAFSGEGWIWVYLYRKDVWKEESTEEVGFWKTKELFCRRSSCQHQACSFCVSSSKLTLIFTCHFLWIFWVLSSIFFLFLRFFFNSNRDFIDFIFSLLSKIENVCFFLCILRNSPLPKVTF